MGHKGDIGINDILRFVLELLLIVWSIVWSVTVFTSPLNIILSIILPVLIMLIWGIFAVPNDPSRSGKAPVPIPGWLRIILEGVIFGFSVVMMAQAISFIGALVYLFTIIFHYAFAIERLQFLMKPEKNIK